MNPLDEARRILKDTLLRVRSMHRQPDPSLNIPPEYQHLIWFVLPNDAIEKLAPIVDNDDGIPHYQNPTFFS